MTGPMLYVMLTWVTWATLAGMMLGDFSEHGRGGLNANRSGVD